MKKEHEIKSKIQLEAKEALEKNNGGLLAMCTGSGKSRIPILYAKDPKNKVKSMAIIVPTELLRDSGWKTEFKNWRATTLYKKVDMYCYASAHKIKNKQYDLVVLDEAHNITELSKKFFEDNQVRTTIALTATPPTNEVKREVLSSIGLETVYELSLEKGQELGVVAPIQIHLIYTELDGINKNVKMGNKEKYFFKTEVEALEYYDRCVDYAYELRNSTKIKFSVLNRTRFIYNLESKTETAKMLLDEIFDERNLIFCGSVKQAEKISPHTFHYKSGKESFNKFMNEEINEIACIKSLNEGHNMPLIDNAVIVQLNSNSLNLIQQIGRACRFRDNHLANIYIFVCKGTPDEKWAEKALADFDKSKIKVYNNIKELLNEKSKN